MAAQEASLADVLSAQIVTLNETMGQMQRTIVQLEARISQTEDEAMRGGHRRSRDGQGEDGDDRNLMSDKFFEPAPFTKSTGSWREWAEDFVDLIAMRDDELAEALNTAKESRVPVISFGDTQRQVNKAKKLYRVIRKLVEHPDARALVVHEADKNVFEAWRAINAKFDPQNDAASTRTAVRLVDSHYWKLAKVEQIPVTLAKWEALDNSHREKTGETVLSGPLKRERVSWTFSPCPCASRLRCRP